MIPCEHYATDQNARRRSRSDRRRGSGRAAGTGQIQHEPPRVARIAIARDETGVDKARDDHRDGALIGERARCEIVERQRRRFPQLRQHKKLRAGNAELRLRLPVADAQHPHETADGIKNALTVAHDVA